MTASRTVVTKPAAELSLGDRIVTSIPGHAAFFDAVTGITLGADGYVWIQRNHLTRWTSFAPDDLVQVLPAEMPLSARSS